MESHTQILRRLEGAGDLVSAWLGVESDRQFVTAWHAPDSERSLSFGEFGTLVRKCLGWLRDSGVRPGDPVVLILPQDVDVMALFTAAMAAGAVPTILAYPSFKMDPRKYREGLAGLMSRIEARLTLVDPDFPPGLLEEIAGSHSQVAVRMADPAEIEQSPELPVQPLAKPQTVAFLQHSAGTTGLQKGVALSHSCVLAQLRKLIEAMQINASDSIVSWLPLYHDMGLIACFALPLVAGLQIVMQSPIDWVLDPGSFLRLATKHRSTLAWLPNFAFQFLARRVSTGEAEQLDLSSLRCIINTSEPLRAEAMDAFSAAFRDRGLRPTVVQTSYGMAENTFAVTNSAIDNEATPTRIAVDLESLTKGSIVSAVAGRSSQHLVSCGRPLPGTQVRIRSAGGELLGDDVVGEIEVLSDCLFEGYYRRPDLTKRALREDGWYRTGDAGFTRGTELFVLGRLDDTIIVGGRNLYPQDIEEIAFSHPSIKDGRAVAFGVRSQELGTEDLILMAEVVEDKYLEQRRQIAMEIQSRVLAELGVSPKRVEVVPSKWLVKSTAGKPARSTNKARFIETNAWYRKAQEGRD